MPFKAIAALVDDIPNGFGAFPFEAEASSVEKAALPGAQRAMETPSNAAVIPLEVRRIIFTPLSFQRWIQGVIAEHRDLSISQCPSTAESLFFSASHGFPFVSIRKERPKLFG